MLNDFARLSRFHLDIQGGPDDIDNMTPEERAELKKREIEAEFLRYKLARRQQQLRDQQQVVNSST